MIAQGTKNNPQLSLIILKMLENENYQTQEIYCVIKEWLLCLENMY